MIPIKTLLLSTILILTYQRCAFRVDQTLHPVKLDQNSDESLPQIVTGLKMCKQYNNKLACCNENNDAQQVISYKQIDSIFGAQGDGCDVCAINLKRFWCEYACSPNQADFTQITGSYYDPTIKSDIQNVTITVQAQTGCDLFSSCKRVSFVTSVSAMGTTAGFLEFQGHNADSQGFQFISTVFTKDMNKSLALSDTFNETQRKSLTACNSKLSGQLHGFPFTQNCSCNTCDTACDTNSGFVYTQSSVFQGFNWILVGSTYLICIILAVGVTIKRKMDEKKTSV